MKAKKTEKVADLGFADRAAFDAAVNATADGPIVNLDGQTIRGGTVPTLEYETLPDGRIVLKEAQPA